MLHKTKLMNTLPLNILALLFILAFALSCSSSPEEGMECIEDRQEDCVCTKQYDPVCGCNGITYGNSCEAYCNGIGDYTEGKCE